MWKAVLFCLVLIVIAGLSFDETRSIALFFNGIILGNWAMGFGRMLDED